MPLGHLGSISFQVTHLHPKCIYILQLLILEESMWEFLHSHWLLRECSEEPISNLMESNVLHDIGIPEVPLVCPVIKEPLTSLLLEIGIAKRLYVYLFQLLSKHYGSYDLFELFNCPWSLELTVSAWQERF